MFLHTRIIVPLLKMALTKHFATDLLIKPFTQGIKHKFPIATIEILFRFKCYRAEVFPNSKSGQLS